MSCNWCKAMPGDRYGLTSFGQWTFCVLCGTDTSSLFPVNVIYEGKKDGVHHFGFERPAPCPGCGAMSGGCTQDCHDEGEVVELPIPLELPHIIDLPSPIKEPDNKS